MFILTRLLGFIAPARMWLIGGAVLAVTGLIGFLWLSRSTALADLDAARSRYNQLQTSHDVTLATLDRVRRDAAEADAAIAREINRRRTVESLNVKLNKEIENAPDDGCVGPAVRGVIDGLRVASPADNKG